MPMDAALDPYLELGVPRTAYAILEDPDRRDQYDQQHPEPIPHAHPRSSPRTWLGPRQPNGLRVTPVRRH
jgi:hypothetical protein